jgi:hypothetical protein
MDEWEHLNNMLVAWNDEHEEDKTIIIDGGVTYILKFL